MPVPKIKRPIRVTKKYFALLLFIQIFHYGAGSGVGAGSTSGGGTASTIIGSSAG